MPDLPYDSSISKVEAEHTYESLYRRLEEMKAFLLSIGINLSGGSRFSIYQRVLEKLGKIQAYGTPGDLTPGEWEHLHDALLECEQFVTSVSTLKESAETDGWRTMAEKALGGHASLRAEKGFTPARDAQFELLIAALLKKGGFLPDFAEPDLRVTFPDGQRVGIAAKRVKSEQKLSSRIRKGINQIEVSQMHGVVAVHLAFLSGPVMKARDMGCAMEMLRRETRSFAVNYLSSKLREVGSNNAFGLLFFTTKLAHLDAVPQLAVVGSIYTTNLCDHRDARCSMLDRLDQGLRSASETWFA